MSQPPLPISTRTYTSDIAFTPAVKLLQQRNGTRAGYARMEEGGSWETEISIDLKAFIEAQRSVFLATVNAEGQPYIQHRGGPPGFLQVLDEHTLGFVDFVGNRQFITSGNLTENPKAHLFLVDYTNQRRVKLWGELRVAPDDVELLARLTPPHYEARPQQVMLFSVSAWDVNCPQHIPQRFDAEDVQSALAERDQRIAELESQLEELKKSSCGAPTELASQGGK
jgi:predicted pyridoxine 5'-phosphate oxidase superfamily flavin-nucleotide-binding protein